MELKRVLESILFNSQRPLQERELKEVLSKTAEESDEEEIIQFKKTSPQAITEELESLADWYNHTPCSFNLSCIAGGWQFTNKPEFAPWQRAILGVKPRPAKLSQPALETLAIIAYRQPITRSEMEQIRGVSVDGVIQTLLERELIEQVGRAEVPGRPITYGTTQAFLECFGLKNLESLPAADELRKIKVDTGARSGTQTDTQQSAPQDTASAETNRSPEGDQSTESQQQDDKSNQTSEEHSQ
ncbi:MAG: SMC-Scp complex subunit ScpB [Verrucomicrobia bacterium]|nr:SMC-Scp complex subunit ScpB [Verrucomicrobiota bacterium]MCF7708136.1 SMC-Scp complex subunit ScpB [Verrucomicrobiota bacterium]